MEGQQDCKHSPTVPSIACDLEFSRIFTECRSHDCPANDIAMFYSGTNLHNIYNITILRYPTISSCLIRTQCIKEHIHSPIYNKTESLGRRHYIIMVIPNTAVFGPTNFIGTIGTDDSANTARMTVYALDEKERFLRWPDGAIRKILFIYLFFVNLIYIIFD